MSLISIFEVGKEYSHLEDNIKKLKLAKDLLTYCKITDECIKLLSFISQIIREKKNLYGKNIIIELFLNIFSFLPLENIFICKNVCKSWQQCLKSNMAKNILPQIPENMHYLESSCVNLKVCKLSKIKKDIYVYDHYFMHKLNKENLELDNTNNINLKIDMMSSNDNYICIKKLYQHDIYVFSHDIKLIKKIENRESQRCLVIDDDDNVIILDYNNEMCIYNIEENTIKKIKLEWNINVSHIRMATRGKVIYIISRWTHHVDVFSHNGKKIITWGGVGSEPGKFMYPYGIQIYKDIIYIADSGNRRIQMFTLYGKFVSEYKINKSEDLSDIIIMNDHVYVSDWKGSNIIKIKLKYLFYCELSM